MNALFILIFLTLSLPSWAENKKTPFEGIPQDAVDYLKSLPGETVSLDMVVGRSLRTSDSFREVVAEKGNIDIPLFTSRARSGADPVLTLQGGRSVDENEPLSAFAPTNTTSNLYQLDFAYRFATGTQFSTQFSHGSTRLLFNNATFNNFGYSSAFTLGVSQDLWRDAFGYGTRRTREAGTLNKIAAFNAFGVAVEGFVSRLIDIYYNAWLAQAQTRAALEGLGRRQRLLRITQIKYQRGTSEEPDLLQVQSAKTLSEINLSDAQQALQSIWRDLVMALKLPAHWMEIDALKIPMVLDQPQDEAMRICGTADKISESPASSKELEQLRHSAEASRLSFEAAKNGMAPQTRLNLEYAPNAVDPTSRATTVSDAFSHENPAWAASISMVIPLGNYEAKSNLYAAAVEHEKSQARFDKGKSDLQVDWVNSCTNLFRLEQDRIKLKVAFENQSRRAVLEERRFNIGRSQPLNIIQAGDDATSAELTYNQAQISVRQAAWAVKRISGKYDDYLKKLESEYQFKKAQGLIPKELQNE